jgi:hypothetical protein
VGGPPRPWPPAGVTAKAVKVGQDSAVFEGTDPTVMRLMVMVGPCAAYFSEGWTYNFQATPATSDSGG